MSTSDARAYHERTKHHLHRYAASAGWLDWANQPDPFRRHEGAPSVPLGHRGSWPDVRLDDVGGDVPPAPLTLEHVGDFLRHALGLSAWKRYGASRWALRVNPSSGNLHPTEGWLVLPSGAAAPLGSEPGVFHYRPEDHALERRASWPQSAWSAIASDAPDGAFLLALSSVPWRESWKYGERALRYCLHDTGHALACLSLSAALLGWRVEVLPAWPTAMIASLLGLDRGEHEDGEPEDAELVASVAPAHEAWRPAPPAADELTRDVKWRGRPNRLSPEHVEWEAVDAAALATRSPGLPREATGLPPAQPAPVRDLDARRVMLGRRSATDFDGTTRVSREGFTRLLAATLPTDAPPWASLATRPRVHLAMFVHRVEGMQPGLHVLARTAPARETLRAACGADFEWTSQGEIGSGLSLDLLVAGRLGPVARLVSCGQDIAADACFSLGMLAEIDDAFEARGAAAYRELHWECGVVGQAIYLAAEAAGLRATGIGCFLDDAMHEALGLRGRAIQTLYHFAVGAPVEDRRLTTEAPYADEAPWWLRE